MPRVLVEPPGDADSRGSVPTVQTLYLADIDAPIDPSQVTSGFGLLAKMLGHSTGDPGSIQMLEQTLAMDRSRGAVRAQIRDLCQIGGTLARGGNYAAAVARFEEGLGLARSSNDLEAQAAMLADLGVAHAARGNYPEALRATEQAHALYSAIAVHPAERTRPDTKGSGLETTLPAAARDGQQLTLLNQGTLHAYLGEYSAAFDAYAKVLALYGKEKAPHGAGTALNGMAWTSQRLGRTAEAQAYADRARAAGSSDVEMLSQSFGNGSIQLRSPIGAPPAAPMGSRQEASSLAMAQLTSSVRQSLDESAAAEAESRGDLGGAMGAWRRVALGAEQTDSADGLRTAFAQLQRLAGAMRQIELAIYYGKRAVNGIQRQRELVATLDRDSRQAFLAQVRPVYESLARSLMDSSRLAEAEQAVRLMREDALQPYVATEGRMPYSEAEQAVLDADRSIAERQRANRDATTQAARTSPYAAMMPSEVSLEQLRGVQLDAMERMVQAYESAWTTRGPGGATMLGPALATTRVQLAALSRSGCAADPAQSPRVAALDARLAGLQAQIARATARSSTSDGTAPLGPAASGANFVAATNDVRCLQQQDASLAESAAHVEPSILERLRSMPPKFRSEDVALLEAQSRALAQVGSTRSVALQYLISEHDLRILVVTDRDRVVHTVAVDAAKLDALVRKYRVTLQSPASDPIAAGRDLYRLLIEPIEMDLDRGGARSLVLSLDGSLRYLPFAALHDGKRWLVERYALAIDSGVTANRVGKASPWRVAGFGSSAGAQGLPPLPAVETELRGVVRDDGGASNGSLPGIVRIDRAFTEQALRDALAQHYPVFHIASHFVLEPRSVANSFLLLGDGTHLSLQSLKQNYRFDGVELLTLSACDTGLDSQDQYGQEFEGLGALIRNQGAEAVLATLWSVADESTGVFMHRFYASHEAEHLSRAEALRAAQLSFIAMAQGPSSPRAARGAEPIEGTGAKPSALDETAALPLDVARPYVHPFYWAPFVLMGDWL